MKNCCYLDFYPVAGNKTVTVRFPYMQAFSPYTIKHLQLTEAAAMVLPKENAYLVFWWQKIPLGHLWVEAGVQDQSIANLRTQIITAVVPALDYYFSKTHAEVDWQSSFLKGDAEPLLQVLRSDALLQTFSNPHADEKLSVVICTRNRTEALGHCINALLGSADNAFELVIIDNAPDDDSTERLVRQFPSVRYVREPRKGLSFARNAGVQQASHPLIAFTDDDVTVDQDWIAHLKACFYDPQTMCVTGLVVPIRLDTKPAYIFERYWGFSRGYVPLVFDQKFFLKHEETGVPVWDIGAGANMAFRKKVFNQLGLFDERLGAGASGCSEDSEFWYRILAEGFQCLYVPHLFVYHQHRDSEKELYSQLFSYMRGHVASLLIQYEKYGHKGNLKRLYHELPKWYRSLIYNKLRGRYNPEFHTLSTEIRGCLSGWRFYQSHKKPAQKGHSSPAQTK